MKQKVKKHGQCIKMASNGPRGPCGINIAQLTHEALSYHPKPLGQSQTNIWIFLNITVCFVYSIQYITLYTCNLYSN